MKITRFRGDTYPEVLILNEDASPINLDSINAVQLAVRKPSGVILVAGTKDIDPTSGRVSFPFVGDLISDVGIFFYDVQAVGIDARKITFIKDRISFKDDVNKT